MQPSHLQPWGQPLTRPQSVQITPRVEGVFDLCPWCRSLYTSSSDSCHKCGKQRHPWQATFLDDVLEGQVLDPAINATAVQAAQKPRTPLRAVVEESGSSVEGVFSLLSLHEEELQDPLMQTCVLSRDFTKCPHCHDTYQADAVLCQQCGRPREYDSEGNEPGPLLRIILHVYEYLTTRKTSMIFL